MRITLQLGNFFNVAVLVRCPLRDHLQRLHHGLQPPPDTPARRRQAVDGAPQGRAQGQGLRRRGQMGRLRDYGHGPHRGDGRDRGPRPLRDAQ